MIRPVESNYISPTAYRRALEAYCDLLEAYLPSRRESEAAKAAERVLDANKAWAEYQSRAEIRQAFEEDDITPHRRHSDDARG